MREAFVSGLLQVWLHYNRYMMASDWGRLFRFVCGLQSFRRLTVALWNLEYCSTVAI